MPGLILVKSLAHFGPIFEPFGIVRNIAKDILQGNALAFFGRVSETNHGCNMPILRPECVDMIFHPWGDCTHHWQSLNHGYHC